MSPSAGRARIGGAGSPSVGSEEAWANESAGTRTSPSTVRARVMLADLSTERFTAYSDGVSAHTIRSWWLTALLLAGCPSPSAQSPQTQSPPAARLVVTGSAPSAGPDARPRLSLAFERGDAVRVPIDREAIVRVRAPVA